MRIKDIEIYPVSIPLKEPFTIPLGTIENADQDMEHVNKFVEA